MENTESSSRATSAASVSMNTKYIALRGGSVATRFSMSSTGRSLNQVMDNWLSNVRRATPICSAQYCSIGELPMTRQHLHDVLDDSGKIDCCRERCFIAGRLRSRQSPLFGNCQQRSGRKELRS